MPGAQWRPALIAEGVKRPRDGQGVSGAQPSTYPLFGPVELRGVFPGILRLCPHSRPAPAVLCPHLWGWLQAAERLGLLWTPGRPSTRLSPVTALPGTGGPGRRLHGRRAGAGLLGRGTRLPHPSAPMASVCTWTVQSCHELSWNTEVWTRSRSDPSPPRPHPMARWSPLEEAGIKDAGDLPGTTRHAPSAHCSDGKAEVWGGDVPVRPHRMSAARLGREPRPPAPPSPMHCHRSHSRLSPPPPAHLSVSCFDDECFRVGQGAGPEPQPHPPQGLPPEQQQREPRQHPDHGVIADGSPWTATVTAEPLHRGTRPGQLGGLVHPHSELTRPSLSTCTRVQSHPTL